MGVFLLDDFVVHMSSLLRIKVVHTETYPLEFIRLLHSL